MPKEMNNTRVLYGLGSFGRGPYSILVQLGKVGQHLS